MGISVFHADAAVQRDVVFSFCTRVKLFGAVRQQSGFMKVSVNCFRVMPGKELLSRDVSLFVRGQQRA